MASGGRLCRSHRNKLMKDLEKSEEFSGENCIDDDINEIMLEDLTSKDNKTNHLSEIMIEENTLINANFDIGTCDNNMNDSNGTMIANNPNISRRARMRWFLAYTLIHNPGVNFIKVLKKKKQYLIF